MPVNYAECGINACCGIQQSIQAPGILLLQGLGRCVQIYNLPMTEQTRAIAVPHQLSFCVQQDRPRISRIIILYTSTYSWGVSYKRLDG